jgi:hypothetical protein
MIGSPENSGGVDSSLRLMRVGPALRCSWLRAMSTLRCRFLINDTID